MKTIKFELNDRDESMTVCPFEQAVPWNKNKTCYVGSCSCECCEYNEGIYDNCVSCCYPEIWAIDCAKDGDIVACNNFVGIFHCIIDGRIMFHCYFDDANPSCQKTVIEGDGENMQYGYTWQNRNWHTASKDEKTLLFSKIESNNYRWDKKEKRMVETHTIGRFQAKWKDDFESTYEPDFVVTPINGRFNVNLTNLDDRQKTIIVNLIYSWNESLE